MTETKTPYDVNIETVEKGAPKAAANARKEAMTEASPARIALFRLTGEVARAEGTETWIARVNEAPIMAQGQDAEDAVGKVVYAWLAYNRGLPETPEKFVARVSSNRLRGWSENGIMADGRFSLVVPGIVPRALGPQEAHSATEGE